MKLAFYSNQQIKELKQIAKMPNRSPERKTAIENAAKAWGRKADNITSAVYYYTAQKKRTSTPAVQNVVVNPTMEATISKSEIVFKISAFRFDGNKLILTVAK